MGRKKKEEKEQSLEEWIATFNFDTATRFMLTVLKKFHPEGPQMVHRKWTQAEKKRIEQLATQATRKKKFSSDESATISKEVGALGDGLWKPKKNYKTDIRTYLSTSAEEDIRNGTL